MGELREVWAEKKTKWARREPRAGEGRGKNKGSAEEDKDKEQRRMAKIKNNFEERRISQGCKVFQTKHLLASTYMEWKEANIAFISRLPPPFSFSPIFSSHFFFSLLLFLSASLFRFIFRSLCSNPSSPFRSSPGTIPFTVFFTPLLYCLIHASFP